MKRVIIVHGWSGNPQDNWLPWLRKELEKLGYKVLVPSMPDADTPEIKKWVKHLSSIVGTPDKNTYFIGHSMGCQTILRYLETINEPVGGALFVAGWFKLENMEDEEEEKIAKPWIETPINLEKVKLVLPKSILIIADNDPFGAVEENRKRFSEVVTEEIVLHNAGHIEKSRKPVILSQFLSLIQ